MTRPRLRRILRWAIPAAAAVLVTVVLVAGGGDDNGRRRLPLSSTTTRADLSGVALQGVDGTTTTTVPVNEGRVSFTGTVRTPGGTVVPGASVRAEWYRVDPPVVIEIVTDTEGRFEIKDVAGGRWRIRAWRTPDFATLEVEDLFVEDDAARTLDLKVEAVPAYSVTWDIETDPPIYDHNALLVVVLAERSVNAEGRTITTPLSGLDTTLVAGSAWLRVQGDESQITDADGRVEWVLRCEQGGTESLRVETVVVNRDLEIAPCIPITATTTTTTAAAPPTTTRA